MGGGSYGGHGEGVYTTGGGSYGGHGEGVYTSAVHAAAAKTERHLTVTHQPSTIGERTPFQHNR